MRFHGEYLRNSRSAEPGGDRAVGLWFTMKWFAEIGEARRTRDMGTECLGLVAKKYTA